MSALKKRMTGLLQRKDSNPQTHLQTVQMTDEALAGASLSQLLTVFFDSAKTSDNIVALYYITERAFESPANAQEAAKTMRKTMTNWSTQDAGALYNAVMLIAILTKHEQGHMFTVNVDDRFAGTVRKVLQDKRRESEATRILLHETLKEFDDTIAGRFESSPTGGADRAVQQVRWKDDAGVLRLVALRRDPKNWQWLAQEQRSIARVQAPPVQQQDSNPLPGMLELSERLHEATTYANVLEQNIHAYGTDLTGLWRDEVFRDFSTRCETAKTSLQKYLDLEVEGLYGHPYDHATLDQMAQTVARAGEVLVLRDSKQQQYNFQRNQSRSPRPNMFSPPLGPPPNTNGSISSATAQALHTKTSDPAARLDNPFDDSNSPRATDGGDHTVSAATNFGVTSTGRPSLAVHPNGRSTSNVGRTVQNSANSAEGPIQQSQQTRYVF